MTTLPDRTRLRQLQDLLASGQFVRLYMNAHLPSSGDTGEEYEEVIAPGYGAALMGFEDWTITEEGATGTEQGFLFLSAPVPKIYGYFLTERITNRFLWADAFARPVEITLPRFELYVTPCLQFARSLVPA